MNLESIAYEPTLGEHYPDSFGFGALPYLCIFRGW